MKLDFLKSLQELQPCGLRPVIDTLSDSYPVMAFSDWKALSIELIDEGYVSKQGNDQYRVTPAGDEAVSKGAAFFADDDAAEEPAAQPEKAKAPHKPAADHPWHQAFSPKNQQKADAPVPPKSKAEVAPVVEPEPESDEAETELDGVAASLSSTINKSVDAMSTDELLEECRLSKDLISSLSQRRQLAVREVNDRLKKASVGNLPLVDIANSIRQIAGGQ